MKLFLTLQAEAIELAGDVGDEALGAPAKAEFGDEVFHHAVEGLVVGFHRLGPQHVLPQEAPDRLPLLPLAGNRQKGRTSAVLGRLLVDGESEQDGGPTMSAVRSGVL